MKHSTPRPLVLLVFAVGCVIAAEMATRALSPYLREPLMYGDEATQVKIAQLDRLGDACIDLVVAGDSTARDGFVPATFSSVDTQHRRAYNASLDAASPEILERWLDEEVVPRLQPSTVVVTVSSLDLNENSAATASARRAYGDAVATKNGPLGRTESWFGSQSALVHYRRDLRDPGAVENALTKWRNHIAAPRLSADGIIGLVGADGEGLSRRPLHYQHDPGTKAFTRDQLLANYVIDPRQVEALRQLINNLRGRGVNVAIAILPVTDDYIMLHPHGRADFAGFVQSVRDVANTSGAPLIDLTTVTPPADSFADTHHLNATGSTWLSSQLPTLLDDVGLARPPRCPS